MRKFIVLSSIVVAAITMSCKDGDETPKNSVKSVKVEQVKDLGTISRTYTGSVKANQSSQIAFKMGGLVQNTYVSSGSNVKKGQILMALDPQDYVLDCNAKRVNLATQEEALKRAERLLAKNAISKQEYEMTQSYYESAKSAYEIAVRNLNDTKLYAPFSGFVMSKSANQYDRVVSGETVLELVNPNDLEITFTVPESNAIYFTKNTELFVEFDTYKGKLFRCKLKELITASPDGAGIPFKLSIDDPAFNLDEYKVAVGFSCNVVAKVVNDLMQGVYSVPISALVPDSTNSDVYVMVYNGETGKVEKIKVMQSAIILEDGMVAIKGDISSDDVVVVAGASVLNDGQQVKVLTK